MTNGDRIRAMNDEELRDFLMGDEPCESMHLQGCTDECPECIFKWLQQPKEDEEKEMAEKENYYVRTWVETFDGGTAIRTYPAGGYLSACKMFEAFKVAFNVKRVELLRRDGDGSMQTLHRAEST